MYREAFKQLVSEWLDQPDRDDLRARIDAAADASAELAELRDEWLRLHRLVREGRPPVESVDWQRFRARTMADVESIAAETEHATNVLNEALRNLPTIEEQVDWERFRSRVSVAVRTAAGRSPVLPQRWRRIVAGLGMLAAAAALFLAVVLRPSAPEPVSGVARGHVEFVTELAEQSQPGVAVARVEPLDVREDLEAPPSPQPQLAEVFLMVDPLPRAGRTDSYRF